MCKSDEEKVWEDTAQWPSRTGILFDFSLVEWEVFLFSFSSLLPAALETAVSFANLEEDVTMVGLKGKRDSIWDIKWEKNTN